VTIFVITPFSASLISVRLSDFVSFSTFTVNFILTIAVQIRDVTRFFLHLFGELLTAKSINSCRMMFCGVEEILFTKN
jgi:hypothetical protein